MDTPLIINKAGGLAKLVINNPQKMNCLGMSFLEQLSDTLNDLEKDKDVKMITITGAGERAFSTGGNLKDFTALSKEGVNEWIKRGNQVFNKLEDFPKPTVAIINGYAIGGGLELALACDFRLALPQARLSMPELQHGWVPGWGGLARIRRLIGEALAKELIYLGDMIDAPTALTYHLIHEVVEPENVNEKVEAWQKKLTRIDPMVFQLAKQSIQDPHRNTSGTGMYFDVIGTQYSRE
ncbi:MAG: enoyl-CoA hydratase/isomerase family protein [Cyclobacteriaceae bacterium]|nr:enoyl-CoA hydratase/isomerase family protein [Cyclobacteriaceae bacterium]